jgi:hypothetical protein
VQTAAAVADYNINLGPDFTPADATDAEYTDGEAQGGI